MPAAIAVFSFLAFKAKNRDFGLLLGVISFGWVFHIFLDFVVFAAYQPLWPFYVGTFFTPFLSASYMAGLDAVFLILWIVHEEVAHKIRDYI